MPTPIVTDKAKIEEIFNRGIIVEVLPSKESLFKRLLSGEKLRFYIGMDPTSTSLHLGHAQNLLLLEDFRKLGHEVIFLIGDFTAMIGDPGDKLSARPRQTREQVQENFKNWKNQVKNLVDFEDSENPVQIRFNSNWLGQLNFEQVLDLASNFTVQQMLERDMFEQRLESGKPIHLHEFLYPLMQGYDSVAMDVDVELCGTDQTFNALAGRTLMKRLKDKEKFIVVAGLIANPKTGELMSKSKGTGVFLSSPPQELFGAIMAQPDEMIKIFLVNNTRIPLGEIESIMALGPRLAKARAALEVVKQFYGIESAKLAEAEFNQVFQQSGLPEDLQIVTLSDPQSLVADLIKAGVVASKAEWRRLVLAGAVRDEEEVKITDPDFSPQADLILKIGKRRFVKIIVHAGNN